MKLLGESSIRKYVALTVEILLVAVTVILIAYRMMRGINLGDECWYVAEPYVVSQGAVPFLNNMTQASGFTIPRIKK